MLDKIKNIRGSLRENVSLAPYTSWNIGGVAKYFFEPQDSEDLKLFLASWKIEPILFLGAGTNVLISDQGINGLVIYLKDKLSQLHLTGDDKLYAESGVSITQFIQFCINHGLIDAKFLAGIPGTIGGLLAMNGGAYGDCIWNHVISVETINRQGKINLRSTGDFKIGYREVIPLNMNEWFFAANLAFAKDSPNNTMVAVREILQKRASKHPLDKPSCGSVFRNPAGTSAAQLIEAAGLKGMAIRDAKVSEKHANFIVNEGNATARDVKELIQLIIKKVLAQHNITLIPEVKILGEHL